MSTIEKMEVALDECENQVITDGDAVWVEAIKVIDAAIAYQRDKEDAAMRAAYGG